ncbi:hypothetical protein [Sulfitobacter guttiformis]|uniref:Uncharacterized protein n=1 Tax=Sulfitobacter guttiformis TaxID=74349 RepID=A0A420DHE1_9RHOB|nr:hypothetical protein [Sulfitobacter guttiformis]KIN72626.1 hypothetical protein Z949_1803 [Sulfitobacter guttiformis KCTC 32187]RKE93643.1 hypothetical protein C8N30_2722 [Sulfitobacter guttiformis]
MSHPRHAPCSAEANRKLAFGALTNPTEFANTFEIFDGAPLEWMMDYACSTADVHP